MIKLEHISKSFEGVSILKDLNYTFPDHGLVCLMGPSGTGKTTLLNLLAGFDRDYEGKIISCGQTLSELDSDGLSAYRRDCVGFVFQNYHLLPGYSVLENVLLPAELSDDSEECSKQKAMALLKRLGMEEKAAQRVETLSGGQKQRVAIARALMGEPQIILADEPTGALDRKTSGEIIGLLKELSETRLVLIISHDSKITDDADEVLYLRDHNIYVERKEELAETAPQQRHSHCGKPSPGKRAKQNFRVHLARYFAVALAVSVGLLAFLFSLSFGNVIDHEILAFQAKNTAFNNGYIKGSDDGTLLRLLQNDSRIETVYYQYMLYDICFTMEGHTEMLSEKYPLAKTAQSLSYGMLPRRGEHEIALTPSLAKKFTPDIQSLIGKEMEFSIGTTEYILTVSGIYNAGYDDFFISSDLEQALYSALPEQENYSLSYDVKAFEDVAAVSDFLEQQGIEVQNAAEEVSEMQDAFDRLGRLFLVISLLILLLAVFLCAVLLVKLQNSRYHELGLLSALGFRTNYIRRMIRLENMLLSGFSACVTALLTTGAYIVCELLDFPLYIGAAQFGASMAGVFVIVTGISAFASVKLVGTEPANALKHE